MTNDHTGTTDVVASLHEVHERIADLIPKLDEANKECINAARSLDRLPEMDLHQRREVSQRIRSADKDRDSVWRLLNETLAQVALIGNHAPHSQNGEKIPRPQTEGGPFLLPTTDGLNLFVHRWLPDTLPKAIVQIAHGVAEHGGRYGRLAAALNRAGYGVYANDHRGHGRTARTPEDLGFFADCGGWRKCVHDLWQLNRHIAAEHPGIPIVLLGHSMGSFMTQQFICEHGDAVCAAVLSGTSGKPTRGAAVVRTLARLERFRVGRRGKSFIIEALTFRAYNDQFDLPLTPFDWLSRDAAEVAKYAADPLCGAFRPSVQLSIDVFEGMVEMSDPQRQLQIPKRLPIYVIAGTRDPVGANGDGVDRLLAAYFDARLECVTHRFYTDARHELFNETNRDEVTGDLIRWLEEVIH